MTPTLPFNARILGVSENLFLIDVLKVRKLIHFRPQLFFVLKIVCLSGLVPGLFGFSEKAELLGEVRAPAAHTRWACELEPSGQR